jgi:nicotinamidase-related amidase
MANLKFDKETTALLAIDPYNDFISEGGKLWNRLKAVAEANNCVPKMLELLKSARRAELHVFYAMHHRYRRGRLRELEICFADPKSSSVAKDFRRWHVGRRNPQRIHTSKG